MMNMSSPNSWLFSDNARYSTQARLLFMGLSFAIGILTFFVYLCIWYLCTRRQRRPIATSSSSLGVEEESGMSEAAIAALPTFLACQCQDEEGKEEVECAVCLGQVEAGEKARRLPKCSHSFHADCVDAWLRGHTTCPMCRAPVVPPAAAAPTKTDTTPVAAAAAAAEALPLPPV